MSNQDTVKQVIAAFSGSQRMLVIPEAYILLCQGDIEAAMFLNQCVYWSDRTSRKDGWFYKSYDEWTSETYLSRYKIDRIRKKLSAWLETKLKRANGTPTMHWRVNLDALTDDLTAALANRFEQNSQMDLRETYKSDLQETRKSLTEITTKITTLPKGKAAKKQPPSSKPETRKQPAPAFPEDEDDNETMSPPPEPEKPKTSKPSFGFLRDPALVALAQAVTKIVPHLAPAARADYAMWHKAAAEWKERGLSPGALEAAARYMLENDLAIARPQSITRCAIAGLKPKNGSNGSNTPARSKDEILAEIKAIREKQRNDATSVAA